MTTIFTDTIYKYGLLSEKTVNLKFNNPSNNTILTNILCGSDPVPGRIKILYSNDNKYICKEYDIIDIENIKNKNFFIEKYFGKNNGYGDKINIAIKLLKNTIDILEEFNIDYFVISGTLLGYIRHKSIIPWDDDIDLIVNSTINDNIDKIIEKYGDELNFFKRDNYIIKICFKDEGLFIDHKFWNTCIIQQKSDRKYMFPFIDLFIYNIKDTYIDVFNKKFDITKFYPPTTVKMYDYNIKIPNNPQYFLRINYGSEYMTTLISNYYSHKDEKKLRIIKKINISDYIK